MKLINLPIVLVFLLLITGCGGNKLRDGFTLINNSKPTPRVYLAYEMDKKVALGLSANIKLYYGHNFYNDDNETSNLSEIYSAVHKIVIYDIETDISPKNILKEIILEDFYEAEYDVIQNEKLKFNHSILLVLNTEELNFHIGLVQFQLITYYNEEHYSGINKYVRYIKNKYVVFSKNT